MVPKNFINNDDDVDQLQVNTPLQNAIMSVLPDFIKNMPKNEFTAPQLTEKCWRAIKNKSGSETCHKASGQIYRTLSSLCIKYPTILSKYQKTNSKSATFWFKYNSEIAEKSNLKFSPVALKRAKVTVTDSEPVFSQDIIKNMLPFLTEKMNKKEFTLAELVTKCWEDIKPKINAKDKSDPASVIRSVLNSICMNYPTILTRRLDDSKKYKSKLNIPFIFEYKPK